ncbi:hypothetical protein BDV95DRAFT_145139 [Massariosphaeria phaeospora]|uniref:Uncharacterized protein n=1 Tax=Massariosphaeria phaeospora TaxID=100035 RepID=A0A7C8MH39_9PLEO|nr:hypothetical protein BDV95DRAFT_145139 [Massariosphaeria phaeospora]
MAAQFFLISGGSESYCRTGSAVVVPSGRRQSKGANATRVSVARKTPSGTRHGHSMYRAAGVEYTKDVPYRSFVNRDDAVVDEVTGKRNAGRHVEPIDKELISHPCPCPAYVGIGNSHRTSSHPVTPSPPQALHFIGGPSHPRARRPKRRATSRPHVAAPYPSPPPPASEQQTPRPPIGEHDASQPLHH